MTWWTGGPMVCLVLTCGLCYTAPTPTQGNTYESVSMREVVKMEGGRLVEWLCVVPRTEHTRLKVRYTERGGHKQVVVVRRKSIPVGVLSVLQVQVKSSGGGKGILSVSLDGTRLPSLADNTTTTTTTTTITGATTSSSSTAQPSISLLLQGSATITNCTQAMDETLKRKSPEQLMKHVEHEVTEGKNDLVLWISGTKTALTMSSTKPSINDTTEGPELTDDVPWWGFMLVLGSVGDVPVLALLLGCLVMGGVVGALLVWACSKACHKRPRDIYKPVAVYRRNTQQGHVPASAAADIIRDGRTFWDSVGRHRNSGIDSAFSTLNTNVSSSNTGTMSAVHNMDHNTSATNNLAKTTTATCRHEPRPHHYHCQHYCSSSTTELLNIPRSGPARTMDNSPVPAKGDSVSRSGSTRSTGSSINHNTARSVNIPYTKTLGITTGHQDLPQPPHVPGHLELDDDSDDSNYDKPYVSPPLPLPGDDYHVGASGGRQPLLVTLHTTGTQTQAKQAPVFQFGTFNKS